jgi:dissimilatory sulfite reductase flavoprotein subunit
MGLLKKNKKKANLSGRSAGPSVKEGSDLRPTYVPKTPPCINACPNGNNIRGMLTYVAQSEMYERTYEESMKGAFGLLTKTNPFPAACGYVCPHPCEDGCNRTTVDSVVSINAYERFMGDYAIDNKFEFARIEGEDDKSEKIAVIGAGPAGLSCAYQMARRGYKVTVFEAFPKAGGMLRYGIPFYRLPESVLDAEIDRILALGIDLKLNTAVGKEVQYDDLKSEYKAIFVGIGAHCGRLLGVDGEEAAKNVMSGCDFLNMVNSGQSVDVGKSVVVIGGGNTAIDAARVSRRLGAEVTLVYRRTVDEMPAIEEEIHEAKIEGINFEFLAAPTKFETEGDMATEMNCCRMELGEPDDSGRRRPVPVEGEDFSVVADLVICAISQAPDFDAVPGIREGREWIKIDEFGRTKDEGIYGGGDDVELGLVTVSIAHGRKAAEAMHAWIQGKEPKKPQEFPEVLYTTKFAADGAGHQMFTEHFEKADRHDEATMPVEDRFGADSLTTAVETTIGMDDAIAESKRCLSCGQCFRCDNCFKYCQDNAVKKPIDVTDPYKFKLELCQGCKKCAENCPCGYIDMN